MTVKEVDGVRIEDGTGVVAAIERRVKNAQVLLDVEGLKFAVKGWLEIGDLDVIEGDTVDYEIHKGDDGYRRYVKLARAGSEGTSAPGESQRDHAPDSAVPPSVGRDDAESGGTPKATGLQVDPPSGDVSRFESYAFLAACGMVDLAYEELTDAKEAGVIEAVTPRLVHDIAAILLQAADMGQRELTGRVDRNAMSHTRARGAVRTALRSYPFEKDTDAWGLALAKASLALLQVAGTL